jgi:hypothetical protein
MVYRAKKRKVAGIQLVNRLDLLQFCRHLVLPHSKITRQIVTNPAACAVAKLMGQDYICIPQDANVFSVDGACFTGPTQIKWMQQLLQHNGHFSLHMDGKYKLHHGVWILLTIGTHCIKVVGETSVTSLCTTFVPLVYLFCKNHESTGACAMLSHAVNVVAVRCFGRKLTPGAVVSDHSAGCRAGMLAEWPETPHAQCWPHIRRKLGEGAFCSKKHPHFDVLPSHLEAIHFAQSKEMRDFLMVEVGKVWDAWPSKWSMNGFWDEYCVAPWDNWSIGLFDCMLCTPSQQAHESWHKQILQSRIPGMFKGSTEHVMHVALPKLVKMDAALLPDKLLFEVPSIPSRMLKKAVFYTHHKATHFHIKVDDDGEDDPVYTFYLLSAKRPSPSTHKKVDSLLVARYDALLMGYRPRGLTKLDSFMDVARALHVVQYASDTPRKATPCQYNPCELVCSCKACRHVGICSHILAVNHWLDEIDVQHLAGNVRGEKRQRGGFNKGVRPALVQEKSKGKKKQMRQLK